ncbi:copper resistance CopC family protein [Amycolatopsis sp.]|uniref:copper resistance CopC family protein n=1 Tax=Amycolatopsis sp. TaxID=37632 RepID=UPI002BB9A77B|nr:copper resistance CopC family protein [Amycolatopsis sp.]HVV13576.1 copper resistance CopC family protein [Amycolatopsis sp.]
MSRNRNLLIRGTALTFAVAILLLAGMRAADAHNVLVSANPAAGAEISSGPSTVELTFNEPVESGFNELVVTGPDKTSHWENGPTTVSAEKIFAPLRPLGPAGEYTVAYHIVSEDGHPVSGSYTFKLTVAGTGSPAPVAQGQAAVAGAPATEGDSTVPVWVWVAGAVVLVAAGVVIARRVAR